MLLAAAGADADADTDADACVSAWLCAFFGK
jgi:hypothetical protein